MSNTKIIVINGNGGVGKDAFVAYCQDHFFLEKGYDGVDQISTVDFVKSVAYDCGWDGSKTPKNRKFLSDLKDLLEQWDEVPNKKVEGRIEFLNTEDKLQILFVHAREPHNIQYYKDKYNAITILVTNPRVEQVTSNHADMGVYDFAYDYIIDNSGDLKQLKESAKTLMEML